MCYYSTLCINAKINEMLSRKLQSIIYMKAKQNKNYIDKQEINAYIKQVKQVQKARRIINLLVDINLKMQNLSAYKAKYKVLKNES